MPTIANQTAFNERLSVILHENSIDPATVLADSVNITEDWLGCGWSLTVKVKLVISKSDADFIMFNTERKVSDDE
jgi:hypothetical protein